MMHKYIRTYSMLKAAGHSPLIAAEIILDCKRGDKYALTWLKVLFKNRRG